MKKLIAVCGESASGKDALVELLLEKYPETFHRKVSYTTRKPRPGELNGKDYHFVTREEFFNLIMTEQMIEAAEIGGEMYGTCINSLDNNKINVGIFDPQGLEILFDIKDIKLLPFYINTDERIRVRRSLDRGTSIDDIYKRLKEDRRLFDGIRNFPHIIILDNNDEGDIASNVRIVKTISDEIF
jgi:guanylate kinase